MSDPLATLTPEMVDSVLLSKDFKMFVFEAWTQIEANPLVWNWHMAAMCDHLQAVSDGKPFPIERLLINIPPGCAKSLITAVLWPVWEWTSRPQGKWLFASYGQHLSTRDSVKRRNLIASSWYQRRWGHMFRFTGDQNLKMYFENDKRGYMLATTPNGTGTGEHPDRIVVDDAISAEDSKSELERENVISWWDQTMATRGVAIRARRVICGQRLHEEDLPGHVLKTDDWDHLCIPMRAEPGRIGPTSLGWVDPRTKKGELLTPLFPEDLVKRIEARLGSYGTAGQLQQRPAPAEGGIIKEAWWKFYHEMPLPFDKVLFSWDATFDKTDDADYVVGQCWGLKGADAFLLDQVRDQMEFTETLKAVKALHSKWTKWPGLLAEKTAIILTLIENKANGPAIISSLRHEVPGIVPWPPKGTKMESKESRLQAVSPAIESGNVYLPQGAAFTRLLIDEANAFHNGAHDDQLDALSQALTRLLPGMWNPAEKKEPAPANLMELRAKQLRDQMEEALRGKDDSAIPARYGALNS